jgi:8-oxo-dGTP pyrophosphatase MutT (NUDIX family)
MSAGEFEPIGSEVKWEGGIVRAGSARFRYADGDEVTRDKVWHPGAVGILAVDDEHVWLTRQPREVIGASDSLEIPAGKLDVPGEPPDDAMHRELAEEIQHRAGRLVKLATFWNSPGFSTEKTHVYVALDLSPCDRPEAAKEEEQDMTIERILLADTDRLIAAGTITDAKTIIGLALAERYLAEAAK